MSARIFAMRDSPATRAAASMMCTTAFSCASCTRTSAPRACVTRFGHAQRAPAAGCPGLQVELAELADVVGVEVRVEDGADRLAADASERECPPAPGPRVDDPHATAGEDRRARLRTSWRRDGRRGPAEQDAERIGSEEAGHVPPDAALRDAGDDRVLHPPQAEREGARPDDGNGEREQGPEDAPHSGLGRRERTVEGRTRRLAEVRDRARECDVVREERQDARPLEGGVELLAATLDIAGA